MAQTLQPRGFARNVLVAFVITLALYVLAFWGLERYRGRQGPWQVTFGADAAGQGLVTIDQARLGIQGVQLRFPSTRVAAENLPVQVRFADPEAMASVPFGEVIFLDTTVLPGTVTLELFGHEIEFLPRVLIIDRVEHPWEVGRIFDLPVRAARSADGA